MASRCLIPAQLLLLALLTVSGHGALRAGTPCEELSAEDLFPAEGAVVLEDNDALRYGDRGRMPERDGDATSGLLFLGLVDTSTGGFTRVYALPAGDGRWTWDHDSWFTLDGGRTDSLPAAKFAAAETAGEALVAQLQAAGCVAPPPLLQAPTYAAREVPGGDPAGTWRPRWRAGTLWVSAGLFLLLFLLGVIDHRRRRGQVAAVRDAAWRAWGSAVAFGAIVFLVCYDFPATPGLGEKGSSAWIIAPLAALPPWWRFAAALIVFGGLLVPLLSPGSGRGIRLPSLASTPPWLRVSVLLLFGVALAVVLFALRIRHVGFGDAQHFRETFGRFGEVTSNDHPLYWRIWAGLADWIGDRSVETSMDLIRYLSGLAGVLFGLLVVVEGSRRVPQTGATRLGLALALCFPGVQVLFFYPEVYGPALAAHLVLLIVLSRTAGVAALVALLVATQIHAVAYALAPFVFWTVAVDLRRRLRPGEGGPAKVPRRELAAFVVVLGLLHWALYSWLDPEANWMLRGNFVGVAETSRYALGAGQWWMDRLGLLSWVAIPALALLPAAVAGLRGPAGRDLRIPAALAVGPHLLYLATWNCTSGVPGDWDLFAVSGLVFGWFAAEAAGRLPRSHPARRVLGPVAVSLGAALTLCFLLANAATRAPVVP